MISHVIQEANRVKYVDYQGISGIKAGFSTRIGGVSNPPYDTLNMGLHTDDQSKLVIKNREIFGKTIGMPYQKWVTVQQVHGMEVIEHHLAGKGATNLDDVIPCADGILTNEEAIPLVTFYADCVPIYLFDEIERVISLIHSGWKGTVGRISANAVKKLIKKGCKLNNIKAIIGPSIGQCCYEVDRPVIDKFKEAFSSWENLLRPVDEEHASLDLWSANFTVLRESGIKDTNIYSTNLCTCCHEELFYSYRRDKGKTGRMAACLMIEQGDPILE